ncbi:MAG: hypothetical protein FWE37_02395 [Spirochaetaceae bacterium]|nr:hypothetical protein [Spirochaetaceae bacterium]
MKLQKILIILLTVGLIISFTGCSNGKGTIDDPVTPPDGLNVDWTNYQGTAAAFRVRNETGSRLIAFRGSVAPANLLGGIPANANDHGVRDNTTLLTTTTDAFPVVLISEEQLNSGASFAALDQAPFSRIFVFYNRNAEPGFPAEVYSISGHLGGNYILEVLNPTRHNWEIRLGGERGPTLGYATSGMQSVRLQIEGCSFL